MLPQNFAANIFIMITYSWNEVYSQGASLTWALTLTPLEYLIKKITAQYFFCKAYAVLIGGDEKRSGYVWYVQGIQPKLPARTIFIDMYIWYKTAS